MVQCVCNLVIWVRHYCVINSQKILFILMIILWQPRHSERWDDERLVDIKNKRKWESVSWLMGLSWEEKDDKMIKECVTCPLVFDGPALYQSPVVMLSLNLEWNGRGWGCCWSQKLFRNILWKREKGVYNIQMSEQFPAAISYWRVHLTSNGQLSCPYFHIQQEKVYANKHWKGKL